MAFLEMAGQRLAIRPGESVIGSDASSAIRVTGAGVLPRHAFLQMGSDGQVVIRRADDGAEIRINGVRLFSFEAEQNGAIGAVPFAG